MMKRYIIRYKIEVDITEVVDFCVYLISILSLVMKIPTSPSPNKKTDGSKVKKTAASLFDDVSNVSETYNENRVGDQAKIKKGFFVNHDTGILDYIDYIDADTNTCINCNSHIIGKRKGAKFCSDSCKNMYHNKQKV